MYDLIVIGGGPAGLTAAYELLDKTNIIPIIFEMSGDIGGISKTVVYKGNRIDIGGHRFFSKSERVMQWYEQRRDARHHAELEQPGDQRFVLGPGVIHRPHLGRP